jgi:hypothetical protein
MSERKEWYRAMKACTYLEYSSGLFKSESRLFEFLKQHGASYGLNPLRDRSEFLFAWEAFFRETWRVAAKLYREGNFASRNAFFERYEYLFKSDCFFSCTLTNYFRYNHREKILNFALMFYDDEADFRDVLLPDQLATKSEAESAIDLMCQSSLANNHSDGEVRDEGEDGDDDEQEANSLEDDGNDSDCEVKDEGEDEYDEYEQEADSLEDDDNLEYENWKTDLLEDASRTYFRFAVRLPSLLDPDEDAFTIRYENDEPKKEEDIENYGAKAAATFAWMAKAFWFVLVILMLVQLARIESIIRTMVTLHKVWQSVDSSDWGRI